MNALNPKYLIPATVTRCKPIDGAHTKVVEYFATTDNGNIHTLGIWHIKLNPRFKIGSRGFIFKIDEDDYFSDYRFVSKHIAHAWKIRQLKP
jgi:hypothetical protein